MVKRLGSLQAPAGLGVAEYIDGDAVADMSLGSDAVDGLLHLAVAAVATFDGVGSGRQQRIVQERPSPDTRR
jgi:hypothetical protein